MELQPLPPAERRVLGVLIEKQKTSKSSDAYPLTLNAMTTGCNQKSNRDPVTEYSDDDVEETCGRLQKLGLVSKLVGGRADRWRHLAYEVWGVSKVEMAVVAELLLRGPQTEGDLRGRASRMDEIADLDALRAILDALAKRNLVVYLSPAGRGAVVTHGFHTPEELAAAKARAAGAVVQEIAAPRPVAAPGELEALKAEVAELKRDVAEIKKQLGIG